MCIKKVRKRKQSKILLPCAKREYHRRTKIHRINIFTYNRLIRIIRVRHNTDCITAISPPRSPINGSLIPVRFFHTSPAIRARVPPGKLIKKPSRSQLKLEMYFLYNLPRIDCGKRARPLPLRYSRKYFLQMVL